MKKWLLALFVVTIVAVFVIWQRSGTKTAYVNGLPEYNQLPGTEYILEKDCYVFKFQHQDTTYPLIGANAPDQLMTVPQLPAAVSAKQIGFKNDQVRILDVVRSGSRFRLVSVRRDQKGKKTEITFEILMVDEADRRYPRLDAYYIIDHSPESRGDAPKMIDGYAVARVRG